MACSGSHCNNHGLGTSTCNNHRTANAGGAYGSGGAWVNTISPGQSINASTVDNLRNQIRAEITRWNSHRSYDPETGTTSRYYFLTNPGDNTSVGNFVNPSASDSIHSKVNTATDHSRSAPPPNESGTETVNRGNFLNAANFNRMVQEYREMKADCICNSDCSCNNVCACHNDCGCNYSDERLKKGIQYC